MKELARLCKVPAQYSLPWANGVMERLWHYTAKYCLQGNIGKVPNAEIAEVCGWPVRRADELVIALLQSGWLDSSKNHRLLVHDWAEHAEDSVKKTLKNRGLQFFFPETSGNVPTFSACLSLSHSQAIAKPEPLATPEMGHVADTETEQKHTQSGNGHADAAGFQSEYPLILAEIRRHDPAVDATFVLRLVQETTQYCLSSPKFPQADMGDITDKSIAKACAESYATGPRTHGTGLLLRRVPHIIETWALEA